MGRSPIRAILRPWVVLASLGIGVLLTILALGLLLYSRPAAGPPQSAATAALTIIPAPSPTIIQVTAPAAQTPLPADRPTLEPGRIGISAFVQVAGTGGDGLRLRTDPGLQGEIRFLGLESEVFQVVDGPRESDGYTWWFLVAPYDENRSGWAVADFLDVIEAP